VSEIERKDKDWEAPDYHKLVLKIANRCLRSIGKQTEGLDPKARWLVIGRVALVIFQKHFGMSYGVAEKAQGEGEK
jgi:hypothetical protein